MAFSSLHVNAKAAASAAATSLLSFTSCIRMRVTLSRHNVGRSTNDTVMYVPRKVPASALSCLLDSHQVPAEKTTLTENTVPAMFPQKR